jgi:hypothetical protein
MLTRRRILLAMSVLLAAALAWSVWLAVQTAGDLGDAQSSVDRIEAAVAARDSVARDEAIAELEESAASARNRTDGFWWSAMTMAPFVGDDAAGVRELSASLDLVASEAIGPLGDTIDDLDSITRSGRIDVKLVSALQDRVTVAHEAFTTAAAMVRAKDSAGFAGAFRSRYDDYVETVTDLARDLGSAKTAVQILPGMLGADEPRQYLLIFENNAEIRATGGLPGSWALVKANDGKLKMALQGAASDFDVYEEPIGDINSAEQALFGKEMGRFFQDPNFTPDFPRAARVFEAFWAKQYRNKPLDGVVSIDVVGLSYLMNGLGPVQSDGIELTAENVVGQLLSKVYMEPDTAKQDVIFRGVARAIFERMTAGPDDAVALVEGIIRAAREGRFHVASFNDSEQTALAGTRIAGELSSDEGQTPHVDIALNDATASKMSYYLRYYTDVKSISCNGGKQELVATTTLSQTISPEDAASLPAYVTGPGPVGTRPGNQLVRIHIFGPYEGTVQNFKINGEAVAAPTIVTIKGRPAVTLAVLIDSMEDVLVSFQMSTSSDQAGAGIVTSTPSVTPGTSVGSFPTSCTTAK